eukprot:1495063-Pleurochrysis_carterae.AAC.1
MARRHFRACACLQVDAAALHAGRLARTGKTVPTCQPPPFLLNAATLTRATIYSRDPTLIRLPALSPTSRRPYSAPTAAPRRMPHTP